MNKLIPLVLAAFPLVLMIEVWRMTA